MTQAYCQLLKSWFRQRRVTSWLQRGLSETLSRTNRWHIQPISEAVKFYSTKADDIDVEDTIYNTPEVPLSQMKEPTNIELNFRTNETDVTKHGNQHATLYYKVPKKDFVKFFECGQKVQFKEQVKTFRECGIMIRKPALEIFQIVDHANLDVAPLKILLYGKNGVGKSLTLSHVVHRLSHQGFVTVHFPDLKRRTQHPHLRTRKFLEPEDDDGLTEHIEEAMQWLRLFHMQNVKKLENVKVYLLNLSKLKASADNNMNTTEYYEFSAREKFEIGSPIKDIVEFGIKRKLFAAKCIGILLKEIKLGASEKKVKVLVALDGVNVFWKDLSCGKKKIPAQQFSMLSDFMKMFEPTWTNGIIISTVCPEIAAVDVVGVNPNKVDPSPKNLLQKEGFKFMDPFIPVEVGNYSKEEAINCLDYYIDNQWITLSHGRTRHGKEELMALSARHPFELMRICAFW